MDPELLTAPVVAHPRDKCRDNLAVTGVYHTMGKQTEALQKAVQRLLRALRQRQKVVKGSRAFVSALDRINKLFTQVCPDAW
jgi:hypothetical protein